MLTDLFSKLKVICGENNILTEVPMKEYTTLKVGGNADILVKPDSIDMVRDCIRFFNEYSVPFLIMGNGSNLIFPDDGFRGVILKIGNKLSKIEVNGNFITAQSGASLAAVANIALGNSLSGLEFASGIPGSVGGAAFMNAGAYGGEMKHVICKTLNVDINGNTVNLNGDENNFSYRSSKIHEDGLVCLQVTYQLEFGGHDAILAKMMELNTCRRNKQPLTMPSAGSVFKRPPGQFAGKLIEDCGLRGYSIGGAQVSNMHCGFIVNTGTATSSDIINLIRHVQKVVCEKTGILLETEVKIVEGSL